MLTWYFGYAPGEESERVQFWKLLPILHALGKTTRRAVMLSTLTLRSYLLAGRALFTLQSTRTNNRYTYMVNAIDPAKITGRAKSLHFVKLLVGPDNDSSYRHIATIFDGKDLRYGKHVSPQSKPFVAFNWLWEYVKVRPDATPDSLPYVVRFYMSKRCCRCGRTLTTPESVLAGIGPECAEKVS